MSTTGLSGAAFVRFNALLKAGVSYRTALALADRVTDVDLSTAIAAGGGGGGGGGTGTVTSVNGKSPVAGAVTLVKSDLGLGNVDNTSDVLKPVSNATSAAISAAIANLVNSAPGTMDTLGEIAALLSSDESTASALATTVAGKMAKSANGSDIASPAAFRASLGLGTAATSAATAFETAGAGATAQANAIAASAQRAANLSDLADKRVSRGNIEVVRLISSPTAPSAPVADDLWIDESSNAASGNYLPYAPNQRGVWAPTTAYAMGDLVINPTGDYVTPKAAHTSGAAYTAANWNIVVPAQNYGRELAGVESALDFNVNGLSGPQDVPGMTMTVPAGIPFTIEAFAMVASVQGSAAVGQVTGLQWRVVDSATATTIYGFSWEQFQWPLATSGASQWRGSNIRKRNAALATPTTMKMQVIPSAVAGQGNIGLFPGTMGGGPATVMQAIGR